MFGAVEARNSSPWSILLALLLIAGFIALGGYVSFWLVNQLTGLTREVSAAAVVAVASLAGILYTRYAEQKRSIEQDLRSRKIPVYEEFIGHFFSIILSPDQSAPQPDLVLALRQLTPKMLIWSSNEVLQRWSVWRLRAADESIAPAVRFLEFEQILLAIRRDAGHSNRGLKAGDLLRLFINHAATVLTPEALMAIRRRR